MRREGAEPNERKRKFSNSSEFPRITLFMSPAVMTSGGGSLDARIPNSRRLETAVRFRRKISSDGNASAAIAEQQPNTSKQQRQQLDQHHPLQRLLHPEKYLFMRNVVVHRRTLPANAILLLLMIAASFWPMPAKAASQSLAS